MLIRRTIKFLRLLSDRDFRRGLRHGVGAAIEHRPLVAGLDLRTLVDIGANVGQFSLLASALFPQARIHAFEPQPEPASVFAALFGGVARVSLYPSAIGTRCGRARMHVSRRNDSSSLLPISPAMSRAFPGTEEVGTVEVAIAPLRCFLSAQQIAAPALLKIDVQGSELEVLKGCEDLLGHFAHVYVELSFVELYEGQPLCDRVVRFLDRRGYSLTAVANLASDRRGRPLQADFLFANDAAGGGDALRKVP